MAKNMTRKQEKAMFAKKGYSKVMKKKARKRGNITRVELNSRDKKGDPYCRYVDKHGRLKDHAPVEAIKGVGPQNAKKLRAMGIRTVGSYEKEQQTLEREKKVVDEPKITNTKTITERSEESLDRLQYYQKEITNTNDSAKLEQIQKKYYHDNEIVNRDIYHLNRLIAKKKTAMGKPSTDQMFEQRFENVYNNVNTRDRKGGMVPLYDIRNEPEFKAMNNKDWEDALRKMERERKIDLQIASDQRFILQKDRKTPIPGKEGVFLDSNRGLIAFAVKRKKKKKN